MEMHQVRYFLAICETLNFTRAAQLCNVAQPSLTRAIKKLEEELGDALFRRERNQTHLTDLGRLMKPHIETIATATESARAEADDFNAPDHPKITLGVMATIGPTQMIGLLSRLKEELPSIDLEIREAPGADLVGMMLAGELELALIGLPDLPERLKAIPLYTERYTVAFAKGHRFEDFNGIACGELDGEDYLKRVHCEFSDHFKALDHEKNWAVNVRYTSEREDWIQALVLAGHGCCVMPEFLPSLPGIATRPVTDPEVSRTISMVTVAGRPYSPAIRAIMRIASVFPWPRSANSAKSGP